MQREHAFRPGELDETKEVGVVGVVGERESGVALVAETRAGIEGPTGEDGGAGAGDFPDEGGTGRLGRTDHDMAGAGGGVESRIGGKGDAERLVDRGEPQSLRMQHDREGGAGEGAEDLLALAQAVTEEHGRVAVLQGGAAKGDDVGQDGLGGRECVVGPAVRRLHDDEVGRRRHAGLGGAAGAELEIAGVEQAAAAGILQPDHGGAVDVAGGMKGDGYLGVIGAERGALPERQDQLETFVQDVGHARAHEGGGARGEEHLAVSGEVVEVGVGNEGTRDRIVRVEPPADLREADAVAVLYVPGHGAM